MARFLSTGEPRKPEEPAKPQQPLKLKVAEPGSQCSSPNGVPQPNSAATETAETATIRAIVGQVYAALERVAGKELGEEITALNITAKLNPKPLWKTRGTFSCSAVMAAYGIILRRHKSGKLGGGELKWPNALALATEIALSVQLSPVAVAPGHLNFHIAVATGARSPEGPLPKRAKVDQPDAESGTAAVPKLPFQAHRLEISVRPSEYTAEEFDLFFKYQTTVHHEKATETTPESFTRFLVDSPIVSCDVDGGGELPFGIRRYGSVHMQYRINGNLVAVGVLDVLPGALSSVYFFYDPGVAFLDFGVYSALTEIDWVKAAFATGFAPHLKYYYMGFYIHNCQKMKYKGAYEPSELLNERSRTWVPLTSCKKLLDANDGKFTDLDPEAAAVNRMPRTVVAYAVQRDITFVHGRIRAHLCDLTDSSRARIEPLLFGLIDRMCTGFAARIQILV